MTLGELNSATSGFSALLVGLGIDFTILTYGRYLEGRLAGLPVEAALDEMAGHTGPAVFLGTITTVGTFYAFLATRFVGLKEFGLLTGTGIVFMMLSAFLLLPALVTLFDRGPVPRLLRAGLRLDPVLEWAKRHSIKVLAAAGGRHRHRDRRAVLAALRRRRPQPAVAVEPGVAVQERVAKAFGLSFNAMMIRVEDRRMSRGARPRPGVGRAGSTSWWRPA